MSTIVLNMSTKQLLSPLFGSKTRVALLGHLVLHPGESFYLRQLAKLLGQSLTPIARELKKLEVLGLVVSEMKANARFFSINARAPIFPEIKAIVLKTVGVGDVLREGLSELNKVEFAFIHGSFAGRKPSPASDLDLFIVGEIPYPELTKAVKEIEGRIGREVQYSIFDRKEFLTKVAEKNDFIREVIEGPKIMLVGTENEFERFAKSGAD